MSPAQYYLVLEQLLELVRDPTWQQTYRQAVAERSAERMARLTLDARKTAIALLGLPVAAGAWFSTRAREAEAAPERYPASCQLHREIAAALAVNSQELRD